MSYYGICSHLQSLHGGKSYKEQQSTAVYSIIIQRALEVLAKHYSSTLAESIQ